MAGQIKNHSDENITSMYLPRYDGIISMFGRFGISRYGDSTGYHFQIIDRYDNDKIVYEIVGDYVYSNTQIEKIRLNYNQDFVLYTINLMEYCQA